MSRNRVVTSGGALLTFSDFPPSQIGEKLKTVKPELFLADVQAHAKSEAAKIQDRVQLLWQQAQEKEHEQILAENIETLLGLGITGGAIYFLWSGIRLFKPALTTLVPAFAAFLVTSELCIGLLLKTWEHEYISLGGSASDSDSVTVDISCTATVSLSLIAGAGTFLFMASESGQSLVNVAIAVTGVAIGAIATEVLLDLFATDVNTITALLPAEWGIGSWPRPLDRGIVPFWVIAAPLCTASACLLTKKFDGLVYMAGLALGGFALMEGIERLEASIGVTMGKPLKAIIIIVVVATGFCTRGKGQQQGDQDLV